MMYWPVAETGEPGSQPNTTKGSKAITKKKLVRRLHKRRKPQQEKKKKKEDTKTTGPVDLMGIGRVGPIQKNGVGANQDNAMADPIKTALKKTTIHET